MRVGYWETNGERKRVELKRELTRSCESKLLKEAKVRKDTYAK